MSGPPSAHSATRRERDVAAGLHTSQIIGLVAGPFVLCHLVKRKRKPTHSGRGYAHEAFGIDECCCDEPRTCARRARSGSRGGSNLCASVAPVGPTWTGLYLGVNGGGGWSHLGVSTTPIGPIVATLGNPGSLSTTINGAVFGGQLGYNWQVGNWVFGAEGDFDDAGINGAQQSIFPGLAGPKTASRYMRTSTGWRPPVVASATFGARC